MPKFSHDLYLGNMIPIDRLRSSVKRAATVLKPFNFDAFAFRGMSGALISPSVALTLNKSLIMVRKLTDFNGNSHSHYVVNGDALAERYIILDDCVCSGDTIVNIMAEVFMFNPKARCIGYLQIDRMVMDYAMDYAAVQSDRLAEFWNLALHQAIRTRQEKNYDYYRSYVESGFKSMTDDEILSSPLGSAATATTIEPSLLSQLVSRFELDCK